MKTRISIVWSLFLFLFLCMGPRAFAAEIKGQVKVEGVAMPYVLLQLDSTSFTTVTDARGHYLIKQLPDGKYTLTASYIGYRSVSTQLEVEKHSRLEVNFTLDDPVLFIDPVVVTGTKTFQRKTSAPVIVNVLSSRQLDQVKACNLSEGLKFQPGLRVETDCQTCNYTQLRMNGLAGGYSQILINGRPIFSPLTGLYGLEQLPVNMVERIEVIRGGGSSLYGSSAIGGTVNVITKIPKENGYEVGYIYQHIGGRASDNQLTSNITKVSKDRNKGVTFFLNHRTRGLYDNNGDAFSELPELRNNAVGTNFFWVPASDQKLELSLSYLREYRYGGEMREVPAHQAAQAEERTHNVWMGSADYQLNYNDNNSSFIAYLAGQRTQRDHYTGLLPDDSLELANHLAQPPYGASQVVTANTGLQINHRLADFLGGSNVFTLGTEFIYDAVLDSIGSYDYFVDQTTRNFAGFIQSDWKILPQLTLLSGLRMDAHNLLPKLIVSPRASLLYRANANTQWRLGYGSGFRAPQAFDTDLHIAFAGGGVSRIRLSSDLRAERSHSVASSFNYDRPSDHFIVGFTLEAFYTLLNHAFVLHPMGADSIGERFVKINGQQAKVQGLTAEFRANYDQLLQFESGFTIQSSRYSEPVAYYDGHQGIKAFIRTPQDYGFASLSYGKAAGLKCNLNYVYTGSMYLPHFAGAPEQQSNELSFSVPFSEWSLGLGYSFDSGAWGVLELNAGVKNILNAYQSDFDSGKNRDSNYVYGPAMPRTVYAGIKWKAL